MDKFKKWWKDAGFANIGLLIAALVLWIFFSKWAFFGYAAFGLFTFWLGLNWQAAKQQTNVDEWVLEKYEHVEKKVHEVKVDADRKIEELERKLKEYINEKVKPFKN